MQNAKSPFLLPILHNNTHHGTFRGGGGRGLTYKWYDVFFTKFHVFLYFLTYIKINVHQRPGKVIFCVCGSVYICLAHL